MDAREPTPRRVLFALFGVPLLLMVAGMVAWGVLSWWVIPVGDF